jgi:hypothetical protein
MGGELESKGISVIIAVAVAELFNMRIKVNIYISYLIGTL